MSTIDCCLSLTTFTDAERAQVKGELSFSAMPAVTANGRSTGITGDITPVMPFGADSIYFDMQWCMHSNSLG